MAGRSLLRTMSPGAGKISPGVMSTYDQCQSAQHGDAAGGTYGESPDCLFGEEPDPDGAGLQRGRGQDKARRIRDEIPCGFGAVGMTMKEGEEAGDRRTRPKRRFRRYCNQ